MSSQLVEPNTERYPEREGKYAVKETAKKAWTKPELKTIAAGSAEIGTVKSNDGGGPMNNHS